MSKYTAPALDKGLDILEYLSAKAIPQTQNEIAQGLDKSPNEIYRMLVCLEERGYLLKNTSSGKFSLSLKLYQLSHTHSPIDGLLKAAKPVMENLSNTTKQSCHMGILHHGKLMVISQKRSPGPVSLSIEEGSLFPLIKTTSGRVLLAHLPNKRLDNLLKLDADFQQLTPVQKDAFKQHLQQIKERGHELAESELTLGVSDIAVPIGSSKSGAFSVLAISSLASVSEGHKSGDQLIDSIRTAAKEINESIANQ